MEILMPPKINKLKYDGGIFYDVQKEPVSIGIVIFNPLEVYKGETVETKSELLGINNKALVAEITDFYPNGLTGVIGIENINERCRKGRGSKLLEEITKDAINCGSELLYVKTNQDPMKNFIAKKMFYQLPSNHKDYTFFYKII